MGILDRIPAAFEHMALLFAAAFGLALASTVKDAGDLSVLWTTTQAVTDAVDAAAVTVAGALVLTFTTLTTRYGRGSNQDPDPGNAGVDA